MGKLDGKVALITGGSKGIGLATAQRFIAEGAEHVFITGRGQEALDEAVKTIGTKNVTAVQCDASNMADLDKLYNVIQKEKGRLDVLFANAGTGSTKPLGSITEKEFDDTFNVHVKGVLFTVQKALPLFADGGSIILNASICTVKGIPGMSVYSAAKAALRSFARCWTVDLKERKIRVNTLSPGPIDTPETRRLKSSVPEIEKLVSNILDATVMKRVGTPDEVAKAAVFLASDDSSYIELFVDGGMAQV
ncbi:unnamed protein product [Rotaria sp. Silwood1]|nr:unnamed protein product [Rotaria sp. Silwood1]CAF4974193.1 unnamed protein product [Rotaria sp. Silwood1]